MPTTVPQIASPFTSSVVSVAIIFPTLATAAVALRLYARQVTRRVTGFASLHGDDWSILVTLLFTWGHSANTLAGAGLVGINFIRGDLETAILDIERVIWVEGLILCVALYGVKISILQLYGDIFLSRNNKSLRYTIRLFYGIISGWFVSSIVCQFLVKDPARAAWDPQVKSIYRYNYPLWVTIYGSLSLFFDVAILCIPAPLVVKLQMNFKRKLSVVGIFWLGTFCCVAAAVRLSLIYQEVYRTASSSSTNPFGTMSKSYLWAHIEPSCSVIAACFPTYGPLFTGKQFSWSWIKPVRSWFSISSFRSTHQPLSDDSSDIYLAGPKSEASKDDTELSYVSHPTTFRPPEHTYEFV